VEEAHRKMLEAHVKVIHLDTLQKTESGLYYAVLKKGTGGMNTDSAIVFVRETIKRFTIRYQSQYRRGCCQATGHVQIRQRLYSVVVAYGNTNHFKRLGRDVVGNARRRDTKDFGFPYWMSSYSEGGTAEHTSAMVYDLELVKVIHNMDTYQTDTLESFRDKYYPGVDSLEKGFYKVTIVPGTGDTLKRGASIGTYYVGKFLNGHVCLIRT